MSTVPNWNLILHLIFTFTTVFGSASTANSECLFSVDPNDVTKYKMDFNFKECGTDYPDSDTDNLIYRNTIQGQEYYNDIILGVKVNLKLFSNFFRKIRYFWKVVQAKSVLQKNILFLIILY